MLNAIVCIVFVVMVQPANKGVKVEAALTWSSCWCKETETTKKEIWPKLLRSFALQRFYLASWTPEPLGQLLHLKNENWRFWNLCRFRRNSLNWGYLALWGTVRPTASSHLQDLSSIWNRFPRGGPSTQQHIQDWSNCLIFGGGQLGPICPICPQTYRFG